MTHSVAEYNAGCVPGQFDPRRVDGLATRGLNPPKSNWARPIDQGTVQGPPDHLVNRISLGP